MARDGDRHPARARRAARARAGAGARAGTQYIGALLFGLTPLDPETFTGVAALFAVVATIAAAIPAYRVTTVDPLVALRHE